MPNWCDNTITFPSGLLGSDDNLPLIDAFRNSQHPFELIRPCPAALDANGAHSYGGPKPQRFDQIRAQLLKDYGYENGYEWRVSNWGTKWDACDIQQLDEYSFAFNTAWSPPLDLYRWISETIPGARFDFTYEEGGVGFQGEGTVWDGQFSNETRDFEYPEDEDDEQPSVPSRVVIGAAVPPKLP